MTRLPSMTGVAEPGLPSPCKYFSICSASAFLCQRIFPEERSRQDRKSTRLNSSHSQISYAVFCLKKKTKSKNRGKSGTIDAKALLADVKDVLPLLVRPALPGGVGAVKRAVLGSLEVGLVAGERV